MTSLSPSEELRSAAQKLRDVAKKADPGPWRPGFEGAVWRSVDALLCESFDENDAQWIAMMHPGLAGPLANWLDDTADDIDATFGRIETSCQQYAVEVASLILGEAR